MKATIFDWCGEAGKLLEKAGYKHNQELELHDGFYGENSIVSILEHLYYIGLNVMIKHDGPSDVVIAVDTRSFKTR